MAVQRRGMTEREYARHLGLSRGAVQKARASGRLVLFGDGSIDARRSDACRAQNLNPAKQRNGHAAMMRAVSEATTGVVNETLREPVTAPTGAPVTFLQARAAHEVLKAQERRLCLQKMKGEVVDRARAVNLVFRLARQERDAWLGWPARGRH